MITDKGKYYLYCHIRLDTQKPFYIGVGTKSLAWNHTTFRSEYSRAYSLCGRNHIWKGITKRTKYDVEILLESDDWKFIDEKEKEFISLYGRIDKATGILCNLTDGGNLTRGVIRTIEHNEKISKALTEKKCSEKNKNYWKYNNPSKKGKENSNSKPIYQYDLEGNFIQEWEYTNKVKEVFGGNGYQSHNKTCFGFQWKKQYEGEKIKPTMINSRETTKKRIHVLDENKNIILCFSGMKNVVKHFNTYSSKIKNCLKYKKQFKNFYFEYYDFV